jgi:hypothetical protein
MLKKGIPVTIQKNRRTVRHGHFYSGGLEVITGSAFIDVHELMRGSS